MNGRVATSSVSAGFAARHGLARALLLWAAGADRSHTRGRSREPQAKETADLQLQHIVDAGLAPLLHYAMRHGMEGVPAHWSDVLKSAELTARFTHAALRDSATEVIDICRDAGVPVTVLKGISISEQCYPAPHLRPMGDVDLLMEERHAALVESTLLRHGYVRMADYQAGEGEPHGAPLWDLRRQVWIEPHTALFAKDAPVNGSALFGPASVARRSIASVYHGRPVQRLCDELQLVYIACYWLRDMTRNRMHASMLVPLLDALYLLKSSARSLDWNGMVDAPDNELATASLYLLLAQARRYGFDEEISPVLRRLAGRQRIIGAAELRIMNRVLDSCLVDGRPFMGSFGARHPMIESTVMDTLMTSRPFVAKALSLPWNVVFPPRVPERYSMGYHAKRIARLVRGKR